MQRKLSSRPESGFWTRTRKNVSAESHDESGVYACKAARSLRSRDGRRRPPYTNLGCSPSQKPFSNPFRGQFMSAFL